MNILRKLQNSPLRTRKVILWSVIVALGLGLLGWWIKSIPNRLESFWGEEFMEKLNLPKTELPKLEMPKEEIEEKLKELEEMTK